MISSAKELVSIVRTDVERIYTERRGFGTFLRVAANPSIRAAFLIRIALLDNVFLHSLARNALISFFGIDVGKGAVIGPGLYLPHPLCIVIGEGARMGANITLYQGITLGRLKNNYPTIGDRSTLYPNVTVIGDVNILADTRVPPGTILRPDESNS